MRVSHQEATMHIIYIEDDPTNIALVERVVRMAQDTLTTFTSAEDAALQIRVDDADLILMDIDFGEGMNGLELTQILRDRGVTTPIIAVTAYDLQDYVQWAQQAGSDQFVVKPVSVPHLLDIFDLYRPS
jgi:two-component system cell cycle response regulator DivK